MKRPRSRPTGGPEVSTVFLYHLLPVSSTGRTRDSDSRNLGSIPKRESEIPFDLAEVAKSRAHTGIKPHPARGRLFSRPGTGETIRGAARPAETSATRRRQGDELADEKDPEGEPDGQELSGQTDWKAEARKWQKRAQENFEKARAYDDDQEKRKTELQKAQEEAAWKKQVDDLNAKAELDAARAKVAKETGVPAELIAGDDEEDSMREGSSPHTRIA